MKLFFVIPHQSLFNVKSLTSNLKSPEYIVERYGEEEENIIIG